MNPVDEAVRFFGGDMICSQAILASFGRRYGLDETLARRVARAFGGGAGLLGRTCGAVNGALMVLGLAIPGEDERAARAVVYEATRFFVSRFEKRTGTTVCRELLGVDVSTEDGYRQARERNLFGVKCPAIIRMAGEVLQETMDEYC